MTNVTNEMILDRGTRDVIVREDLEKKLASGQKLRIKLGIDPTKPDLHLGHAVPLRKLKQFQDAGHQVVLLFGGFTATIGDPTGKNEARPVLTLADVEHNAAEYLRQAGKILDLEKVELVNNRDWLGNMSPEEMLQLMAQFTVGQMMERDMFQERVKKNQPVYCHELTYPLLQGYDSVAIRADVEIGGTDQLFNLLAGRPLQRHFGQEPQNVLTVPLIPGTDGTQKMSKSLGNYIGLDDEPKEIFGKMMSIPDSLIELYFEVLTDCDMTVAKAEIADNPRNAKVRLAKEIITWLCGAEQANAAEADFIAKFVKKEIPDDIPELVLDKNEIGIIDLLKTANMTSSTSEARRLVTGGGVSINAEKVTDISVTVTIANGAVLKVGKRRFVRIKIN